MADIGKLDALIKGGIGSQPSAPGALSRFGSGVLRKAALEPIAGVQAQTDPFRQSLAQTQQQEGLRPFAAPIFQARQVEQELPQPTGVAGKAGEVTGFLAPLLPAGASIASLGRRALIKGLKLLPGGLESAGKLISSRFNSILGELGGATETAPAELPENASDTFFGRMSDKFNEIRGRERDAYDQFADLAKGREVFTKTNTVKAVDDALGKLPKRVLSERNKELEANLLELKDSAEGARNVADLKELDTEINGRLRNPNIISKIGNFSNVVSPIKSGIEADFEKTAANSGRPEIVDAWQNAKAITRDEKAPFISEPSPRGGKRPTAFAKLLAQETPDSGAFLNRTISSAKADDVGKMRQLFKVMPDQTDRDLVGLHYLKEGFENPSKMMQKWNALGTKTKRLLFPNHWKEMDRFSDLQKESPEAFRGLQAPSLVGRGVSATRLFLGRASGLPIEGAGLLLGKILGPAASKIAFEVPSVQRELLGEIAEPTRVSPKGRFAAPSFAVGAAQAGRGLQTAAPQQQPISSQQEANILAQLRQLRGGQ